jgi:omega-amidase
MRLYCCQFDIVWEDKAANYGKIEQVFKTAFFPPGSLVALPEMFATGFSMDVPRTAEEDPSETERFLAKLASAYNCHIIGGLVRKGAGHRGRNEAVAFDAHENLLARYCKIQPFPLAGETDAHEAGTELAVFSWSSVRVAPFICYDLRFPELFRQAVLQGAHLLLVMANWPAPRIGHWTALLRARAIENQCYVAGVNRCGSDPNFPYPGRSALFDPHGELLAEAGADEQIISAEIDLEALEKWRDAFPVLTPLFATGVSPS